LLFAVPFFRAGFTPLEVLNHKCHRLGEGQSPDRLPAPEFQGLMDPAVPGSLLHDGPESPVWSPHLVVHAADVAIGLQVGVGPGDLVPLPLLPVEDVHLTGQVGNVVLVRVVELWKVR